jgi:hypothetical protein
VKSREVPTVLALLALLVLGACGSNGGSTSTSSDDQELRPADEVIDGTIGEETDLGAGLAVTVSEMRPGGDDGGPWLEVDLRVENRGEDTSNPLVAIACSDSSEEGGWQVDSAYNLFDELPASTFNEGTINLLLPGDGRSGEPVPTCSAPAVVRVTPNDGSITIGGVPLGQVPADFLINPATLDALAL